jgi:hypothetical protein
LEFQKKTANMSTYKKDFTIRPADGKYLNPWDCSTMQDGQECCIVLANPYDESPRNVVATYRGGGFYRNTDTPRWGCVTEATPIAPESQWPTGRIWSTEDWEEMAIYPPQPVQQAVFIVTMPDGKEFEVLAPFTDETPETDEAQINYQVKLETFERHIRNAYQYSNYPYVLPNIKTRWAWQEKPETK